MQDTRRGRSAERLTRKAEPSYRAQRQHGSGRCQRPVPRPRSPRQAWRRLPGDASQATPPRPTPALQRSLACLGIPALRRWLRHTRNSWILATTRDEYTTVVAAPPPARPAFALPRPLAV